MGAVWADVPKGSRSETAGLGLARGELAVGEIGIAPKALHFYNAHPTPFADDVKPSARPPLTPPLHSLLFFGLI